MDWDDLKTFFGITVLIIGTAVSFAYINVYINEKIDKQNMKEILIKKI